MRHAIPDPSDAAASLAKRTLSAGQWRLAAAVLQSALQFAVGVLLARLLRPEDFGLVALAVAVSGFAALLADLGLGPALIHQHPLTERHVRVGFSLSILLGIGTAAAVWAVAPLCGVLLDSPELPRLLRVQAALFILLGAGSTARALLQRSLDFRRLFFVEMLSFSLGYALVSISLVLLGFGVWSLIGGMLAQAALSSAIALLLVAHPARPLVGRAELRDLVTFGVGGSLNGMVNYLALHGDNLMVGRRLGTHALGLYGRAFSLMMLPLSQLGSTVSSVLFPAFAEIRGDRGRLGNAYLLAVQLVTLVAAPVMVGMAVAAPHLVVGLYGPAWAGAAPALQVLCLAGIVRSVYLPAGAVTRATGRVYAELRWQIGYAALVLVGAWVGSAWGVVGAASGVAVAIVFKFVGVATLTLRIVGRGWADFLRAQAAGAWVGANVGLIALLTRWGLERQGAGALEIAVAIAIACALTLPVAIHLLPRAVRPVHLFGKLADPLARCPRPLQRTLVWALHISG